MLIIMDPAIPRLTYWRRQLSIDDNSDNNDFDGYRIMDPIQRLVDDDDSDWS